MRAYGWARRVNNGMDYWLNRWEEAAVASKADVVIVDDVRHINEYDFMLLHGGHFVALEIASVEPLRTPDLPAIIQEVWDVRDSILATKHNPIPGQRNGVITVDTPQEVNDEIIEGLVEKFLLPVLHEGMDWLTSFALAGQRPPVLSLADQLAAALAWQAGAKHYAAGGAPTHNPHIFKDTPRKIVADWQNGFGFARGADISGRERAMLNDWAQELMGMMMDAIKSPAGVVPDSCTLTYENLLMLQQDQVAE
jgi:hypothetical protein